MSSSFLPIQTVFKHFPLQTALCESLTPQAPSDPHPPLFSNSVKINYDQRIKFQGAQTPGFLLDPLFGGTDQTFIFHESTLGIWVYPCSWSLLFSCDNNLFFSLWALSHPHYFPLCSEYLSLYDSLKLRTVNGLTFKFHFPYHFFFELQIWCVCVCVCINTQACVCTKETS